MLELLGKITVYRLVTYEDKSLDLIFYTTELQTMNHYNSLLELIYVLIIFLSMTFIVFVSLHLYLLMCGHDFRDVNITFSMKILNVRPRYDCAIVLLLSCQLYNL